MAPERRGGAAAVGDRVLARLTRLDDGSYEGHTVRRISERPDRVLGVYEVTRARRLRPADRPQDAPRARRSRAPTRPAPSRASWCWPSRCRAASMASRRRASSSAGQHREPARHQPDRHPHPRHPDRLPARGARAGRRSQAGDARRGASICAAFRSSPSTARTRATSTTRSGPSPMPIRRTKAAGICSSPSPTSRTMCGRPTRSTAPPMSAATRSISPTASCRCCRRRCRTISARCRPKEDRACLAAQLWIDGQGRLKRHRFDRALMRSAARLTYEQVQAAAGRPAGRHDRAARRARR